MEVNYEQRWFYKIYKIQFYIAIIIGDFLVCVKKKLIKKKRFIYENGYALKIATN